MASSSSAKLKPALQSSDAKKWKFDVSWLYEKGVYISCCHNCWGFKSYQWVSIWFMNKMQWIKANSPWDCKVGRNRTFSSSLLQSRWRPCASSSNWCDLVSPRAKVEWAPWPMSLHFLARSTESMCHFLDRSTISIYHELAAYLILFDFYSFRCLFSFSFLSF